MTNLTLFTEEDKQVLFEGFDNIETDKQDEFLVKLESAIVEKVTTIKEKFISEQEELFAEKLEEETKELTEEMENNINEYLDYVVEQWMQENEIALESGIKLELMENFIANMRKVFAESYIEMPEETVDVVNTLEEKLSQAEVDMDKLLSENMKLKREKEELEKSIVIEQHSEGLTDTEVERFKLLTEGLAYSDIKEFDKKVKFIRESYFNKTNSETLTEETETNDGKVLGDDKMSIYLKHL